MACSFACDHLERYKLMTDLSEIEEYIFNGTESDKLCLLDARLEIYEEVDNLSNIIAIHFNNEYRNIVSSITFLGSFGYSILLSRNYEGESYTIRMRDDPVDSEVKDTFQKKLLEKKIETSWLLSRPYYPDTKEWTAMGQLFAKRYIRKAIKLQREMAQQEITEDCMKQAGFGDSNKLVITEEMIAELSECIARRMVNQFVNSVGNASQ